jgi:hypothetical protein
MNYDRDIITVRQLIHSPEWDGDVVYFIGCPETKKVKIGKSTNSSLPERFSDLQSATPDELHIFGIIKGGFGKEREMHAKFYRHHIRREWFRLTDNMVRYIENNTTEVVVPSKSRVEAAKQLIRRRGRL